MKPLTLVSQGPSRVRSKENLANQSASNCVFRSIWTVTLTLKCCPLFRSRQRQLVTFYTKYWWWEEKKSGFKSVMTQFCSVKNGCWSFPILALCKCSDLVRFSNWLKSKNSSNLQWTSGKCAYANSVRIKFNRWQPVFIDREWKRRHFEKKKKERKILLLIAFSFIETC